MLSPTPSHKPDEALLARHLPVFALLLDPDDHVRAATGLVSRGHAKLDGATPESRSLGELLPAGLATAASLDQRLRRVRELGVEVVLPRVDLDGAEGRSSFTVAVVPVVELPGYVAVHVEDITNVLADARTLYDREAMGSVTGLAETLAHEIRNPLAGISGTLQILVGSMGLRDPRRKAVDQALLQIQRLGRVVEELIVFARAPDVRRDRVDLAEVTARALDGAAAGRGDTEVEGAGSAWADGELLMEVVGELVDNAWQAGASRVVVRLGDGAISVLDDGPGISAADQARIFHPFYTTRLQGLGLGLARAHRAVEAMGGRLEARPSPLGGAAFEIRLSLPSSSA